MSANLHGEWDAYQRLDRLGDPWVALNELVDFEAFRAILEDCWRPADAEPSKGGRPPYDAILMFKLLCNLIGQDTRVKKSYPYKAGNNDGTN